MFKILDSWSLSKIKNASSNWEDNYICDIRPIDGDKGIFEVFKYCFKDMDIKNYEVFKHYILGLKIKDYVRDMANFII